MWWLFMRLLFIVVAAAFATEGIPKWKCWKNNVDELNWKLDEEATLFAEALRNAQPEPLEAGLEKITITQPLTKYPIPNKEKHLTLITRTSTRELYDEVLRQMGVLLPAPVAASSTSTTLKAPPPTARLDKAVVEGNPGIGKSLGLFHPLRHLLRLNQFVVFHYAKLHFLYAFVPASMNAPISSSSSAIMPESATCSSASGVSQLAPQKYVVYTLAGGGIVTPSLVLQLKNPDAFFLFDPSETSSFPLVRARSIVPSSSDPEKIKAYWKEGAAIFFMPMYTREEVCAAEQSGVLSVKPGPEDSGKTSIESNLEFLADPE